MRFIKQNTFAKGSGGALVDSEGHLESEIPENEQFDARVWVRNNTNSTEFLNIEFEVDSKEQQRYVDLSGEWEVIGSKAGCGQCNKIDVYVWRDLFRGERG